MHIRRLSRQSSERVCGLTLSSPSGILRPVRFIRIVSPSRLVECWSVGKPIDGKESDRRSLTLEKALVDRWRTTERDR